MKNLDTYAALIAKFACVDGGIVLTKDFDLIGFGAQAIVDLTDIKPPKMRYIAPDNSENLSRKFNGVGMRHRACYRFCKLIKDSVAIIFSQDGTIEACTAHMDEVVVYENVTLSVM